MNYVFKTLFLLLILSASFASTDLFAQDRATYEVKQGDTLYGISKKLNTTIAELKEWNNLASNEIELGQQLIYYVPEDELNEQPLPDTPSDPLISNTSTGQNTFYTVKSGDTLYRIASMHNMTLEQLKSLNNLESNDIRVGQQLAVKKVSVAPNVAEFLEESTPQGVFSIYKIKRGETVREILGRYKMTETEFRMLNPEIELSRIGTGQDVTVLLPPSRNYENPYLKKANLQDLGSVNVFAYNDSEKGKSTTNGELYDPQALTAAHSNIALGSIMYIENSETGNGVYVRINDRITATGMKLSHKAYEVLRLSESGQPVVTIFAEEND